MESRLKIFLKVRLDIYQIFFTSIKSMCQLILRKPWNFYLGFRNIYPEISYVFMRINAIYTRLFWKVTIGSSLCCSKNEISVMKFSKVHLIKSEPFSQENIGCAGDLLEISKLRFLFMDP